ncbi:hypothetical protein KKH30_02265 [Candidatus Micrarchaeota archaeon]|nr:hypothetical protein [Candidatus Micrarchaeota archaeon]MBU1939565.1 hypothetical protein [Candidatus Micrarchaeota archaeon]
MPPKKQKGMFDHYKIARFAVLAKKGAGADEIVSFLRKRYYPTLSNEEVYKIYFEKLAGGVKPNLRKNFIGKSEEEITANFKKWLAMRKKILVANKAALKGVSKSQAHRNKLSVAHKGKIISQYTRNKISATLHKNKPWVGRVWSDETIKKMSDTRMGKSHSKETRAKISDSITDYWGQLKGSIIAEMEAQGIAGEWEKGVQGWSGRVPASTGPERAMLRRELNRVVREAVSELPKHQRQIIYLRFGFNGDEFEIKEIAKNLSNNGKRFTPSLVRSQLSVALKTLSRNPKLIELVSS